MRMILMGPPGAGKGTQSTLCSNFFNVPKLATGDILRSEIHQKTELGILVKETMERGDLVSDDLVLDIIKTHINDIKCRDGFILDGIPRNVAQAKRLDQILLDNNILLDAVVSLEVEQEELIKRFTGRRVSAQSGYVYHIEYNPPKINGVCDITGEELIQRKDDDEQKVRHRLDVYWDETSPVLDYYKKQNRLVSIDGNQAMDCVFKDICAVVSDTTS